MKRERDHSEGREWVVDTFLRVSIFIIMFITAMNALYFPDIFIDNPSLIMYKHGASFSY